MSTACTQLSDLLPEYLDGEIDSMTQKQLEQHMKECPRCQAELSLQQEWLRHRQTLRDFSDRRPIPDGMNDRIMSAIRTEHVSQTNTRLHARGLKRMLPRLAGAAAMIVLLVTAATIYQNLGQKTTSTTRNYSMTEAALDTLDHAFYPVSGTGGSQAGSNGKSAGITGGWGLYSGKLDALFQTNESSQMAQATRVCLPPTVLESLGQAEALRVLTTAGPPAQTLVLAQWPVKTITKQIEMIKNEFATCGTNARIEIIKSSDLSAKLNSLEPDLFARVFEKTPSGSSWIYILLGE